VETIVLPRFVAAAVYDRNSDIKTISAVPVEVGNSQEHEVQVLNLKFCNDDDNNDSTYSTRGSEPYVFASTRFPIVRHDAYFGGVVKELPAPVVSEVDSNFSRQVRYQ